MKLISQLKQISARPAFVCLWLAVVTLAVYGPVVRHDFINYDDPMCVTENPHLEGRLTWAGLKWALSTGYYGNWMPVTWLSHMLDVQMFDLNPGAHHAISLLLHAASTVLLFLLLRRLTGAHWRSSVVAALFALHPLHVEPVAWAAMRRDVLSTFFFMLTLWVYAGYVEAMVRRQVSCVRTHAPCAVFPLPASIFYLLALLFFALGLMSKQMLLTLPFVLLLLDYWPLGRLAGGRWQLSHEGASSLQPVSRLFLEKLPFFTLAIVSTVIAFVTQRGAGALRSLTSFPLRDRVANALTSYVAYLRKLIWPDDLSVFYPYPLTFPAGKTLLAGLFLLALTSLVLGWSRRRPWLVVGWFWYLGTLVPVIGLVQIGSHSMADRYAYLPLIGLFIMLVWGVAELASRWSLGRVPLALGAVVALTACAAVTTCQLSHWRNTITIFKHALSLSHNNAVAHDNLGAEYCAQRKYDLARPHFEAALQLTPQNYVSQCHIGFLRFLDGKFDDAIYHFTEALRLKPGIAEAESGLGAALVKKGRSDEAINHLREAVRLDLKDVAARANLGKVLFQRSQVDEAIELFEAALRIKPEDTGALTGLATAMASRGQLDEAIRYFTEALRVTPDSAQLHKLLARALAEQGKWREAITHYSAATRLEPREAETLNQLGAALAKDGKLDEAIACFNRALESGTNQVSARENLGLALVMKSKIPEAIAQFREALRLQPDSPQALNNLAWLLATHRDAQFRDGRQAVQLATRAVALTRSNDAAKLDTLAAAYAEAGQFSDAVNTARQALGLAVAAKTQSLADGIGSRLKLYQSDQPYRE